VFHPSLSGPRFRRIEQINSISHFLEQARQVIRARRFSIRTETSYLHSMREYLRYHGDRHPDRLGAAEIRAYLAHLAVDRHVAAATQNVARRALLLLYQQDREQRPGGPVISAHCAK